MTPKMMEEHARAAQEKAKRLILPGQPETFDMADFDQMPPDVKLRALHAGFEQLHARMKMAEAELHVVFELWAVVGTLVDVTVGRGRNGMRSFLGRLEETKLTVRAVVAGAKKRAESSPHRLLDAIRDMDRRFMERVKKAQAAKEPSVTNDSTAVASPKPVEPPHAERDWSEADKLDTQRQKLPPPHVLLQVALAVRAEMQETGGEPLTRVRVEFEPTDAHRLALAADGFVLEGPGQESVGSVLLKIGVPT